MGDPRMRTLVNVYKSFSEVPPLAHFVSTGKCTANARGVAVFGFQSDEGTLRNGGRGGGAEGPGAFRRFLMSKGPVVNPEHGIDFTSGTIVIVDAGNVARPDCTSLEHAHAQMRFAVRDLITKGYVPFCVGGSNDQSYCNARALMDVAGEGNVAVVNIDAHLDVRPLVPPPHDPATTANPTTGDDEEEEEESPCSATLMPSRSALAAADSAAVDDSVFPLPFVPASAAAAAAIVSHNNSPAEPISAACVASRGWAAAPAGAALAHSGSPFRLLLQSPRFDGGAFCEFAAQGMQCSAAHARYAKRKGAAVHWLSGLADAGRLALAVAAEADAVPSAAPGGNGGVRPLAPYPGGAALTPAAAAFAAAVLAPPSAAGTSVTYAGGAGAAEERRRYARLMPSPETTGTAALPARVEEERLQFRACDDAGWGPAGAAGRHGCYSSSPDAVTPHRAVFVSFDIDAVSASAGAPGVSCPSPIGLTAQDALDICFVAGRDPHVRLFDLSELCPAAEGYVTPMLAAYMFYHFVMGLAVRQKCDH